MKFVASFPTQLPFVILKVCDFVLTTILETQKIIEAKRKMVCALHSVTTSLVHFNTQNVLALADISIMLECLYAPHVSNEAQSIENINDRKNAAVFLMTKTIYILKL